MPDFPMTKEQFRAWLERQGPDDVVGVPRVGESCPLAEACSLGKPFAQRIYVGKWQWGFTKGGGDFALPEWAQEFVDAIDGMETEGITAQACLDLLGEEPK